MTWPTAPAIDAGATGLVRVCCVISRLMQAPDFGVPGGGQSLQFGPTACKSVAVRQEEFPWRSGCQAS